MRSFVYGKKQGRSVILALLLIFCMPCVLFLFPEKAYAKSELVEQIREGYSRGQYVYDTAYLLNSENIRELEAAIGEYRDANTMDVFIVTVNDRQEYSTIEDYADALFYSAELGTGSEKDGAMLLVDMGERDVYLYTHGNMIRYLTDERLDDILYDKVIPAMGDGDMMKAFSLYVEGVSYYTGQGIPGDQVNVDAETGAVDPYRPGKRSLTIPEIIISAVLALLAGFFPTKSVKSKYGMQEEKAQAEGFRLAYRKEAAFAFTAGDEAARLIDRHESIVPIPAPQPASSGRTPSGGSVSTTHIGMGGSSHGGKGGKF